MPRALATNDDGIDSPGLHALAAAARDAGLDVIVAAPAEQSSGAGAALTAVRREGRTVVTRRERPGAARRRGVGGRRAAGAHRRRRAQRLVRPGAGRRAVRDQPRRQRRAGRAALGHGRGRADRGDQRRPRPRRVARGGPARHRRAALGQRDGGAPAGAGPAARLPRGHRALAERARPARRRPRPPPATPAWPAVGAVHARVDEIRDGDLLFGRDRGVRRTGGGHRQRAPASPATRPSPPCGRCRPTTASSCRSGWPTGTAEPRTGPVRRSCTPPPARAQCVPYAPARAHVHGPPVQPDASPVHNAGCRCTAQPVVHNPTRPCTGCAVCTGTRPCARAARAARRAYETTRGRFDGRPLTRLRRGVGHHPLDRPAQHVQGGEVHLLHGRGVAGQAHRIAAGVRQRVGAWPGDRPARHAQCRSGGRGLHQVLARARWSRAAAGRRPGRPWARTWRANTSAKP